MLLLLTLNALSVAGQESQGSQQTNDPKGVYDPWAERPLWERWEDEAPLEDASSGRISPPEIVPDGWLSDYDYQSNFGAYLSGKYQEAMNSGKNTYVYLYADWLETCRAFRKFAGRKDYAKLFLDIEIIMLDYSFFRQEFDTRIRNLPLIVKVNKNGVLGPESINPTSNKNDHPKRAYYKLEKFFNSNEEIH